MPVLDEQWGNNLNGVDLKAQYPCLRARAACSRMIQTAALYTVCKKPHLKLKWIPTLALGASIHCSITKCLATVEHLHAGETVHVAADVHAPP
eukprot:SAG31_NODE_360_length_17025_cov_5.362460_5_plen_93_part_00